MIGDAVYPDGYKELYSDEKYISIGGFGWSAAMAIDVVRLRALQFASSEQFELLAKTLWVPGNPSVSPAICYPAQSFTRTHNYGLRPPADGIPSYDEWCNNNDEFIGGQQSIQRFYDAGPMAKIQLQLVRSMLFVKAKNADSLGMTDEQSRFLEIGFEDWVQALWGRVHNYRKAEYISQYGSTYIEKAMQDEFIFADYDEFRHKIFMCVSPDQQITSAFAEFLLEIDSTQEVPLKAQQMDSYYSKLVKGAMVNIPISVVWSPSDETEHSTFDNEKFANVMWKTLVKIMDSESIRRGLSDSQLLKGSVSRIKMLKIAMKVSNPLLPPPCEPRA